MPEAARPTAGSADLCFVAVGSLAQTVEHLHAIECPIEEGPVRRTGALGPMTSVSVCNPDANLVERLLRGPLADLPPLRLSRSYTPASVRAQR